VSYQNGTLDLTQCHVKEEVQVDRRTLNATAASLLGFLHDGASSGYELAARAEAAIGDFWSLTQSQVYRELAWMADAGLVAAGERGTRERRPYSLTDAGREAFAAWLDRPPGPETIRHPLLLTVSFGRHVPPERLATFLRQHREAHAERLRTYEAQAEASARVGDHDPYRSATLAFGLAYERAVMAWFDEVPGLLGS
jgi:DNA-binding PadR family transcriptional regulator